MAGKAIDEPSSCKQRQRLLGLGGDFSLVGRELARLNQERLAAALGRKLIQPASRFIDGKLHLQHLAEAGLELRERAGDLFLAKLPQDFLQFGFGFLQLFAGCR